MTTVTKQKKKGFYKAFLQSILIAWGEIPHPRASVGQLQEAIKLRLVELKKGTEWDPEIPSDLWGVLLPALHTRGVKGEEIVKLMKSMKKLESSSKEGAGATLSETAKTAETEGLLENIGDVLGGILSLDIGETIGELGDTLDDFLSGGWF